MVVAAGGGGGRAFCVRVWGGVGVGVGVCGCVWGLGGVCVGEREGNVNPVRQIRYNFHVRTRNVSTAAAGTLRGRPRERSSTSRGAPIHSACRRPGGRDLACCMLHAGGRGQLEAQLEERQHVVRTSRKGEEGGQVDPFVAKKEDRGGRHSSSCEVYSGKIRVSAVREARAKISVVRCGCYRRPRPPPPTHPWHCAQMWQQARFAPCIHNAQGTGHGLPSPKSNTRTSRTKGGAVPIAGSSSFFGEFSPRCGVGFCSPPRGGGGGYTTLLL